MEHLVFKVINNSTLDIFIKLKPDYRANTILGVWEEDNKCYLNIGVTEQAIESKANKKLITFLSTILEIARSDIILQKGRRSSYKTVRLVNLDNISNIIELINKMITANK